MIVIPENDILTIKEKFQTLSHVLNERSKRIWAATEAMTYGKGGVTAVHKATKIARNTIYTGLREIELKKTADLGINKIRRSGGGPKFIEEKNPEIENKLEILIDSSTRGDPESPLKWVAKSTEKLAYELSISKNTIVRLLKKLGYSLQSNRKKLEGKNHPDRNEQFEYINNKSKEFLNKNLPVISVDTKKKENIGEYKNNGSEYSEKGKPIAVSTYDFPDKKLGKIAPYGILTRA